MANEIPQPGITITAEQRDIEILYSTEGLDIHPGTLVQDATAGPLADGYLPAGTLLGRVTATGKYAEYDNADSPAGVGVARCVLRVGTSVASGDKPAPLCFGGRFKYDKVLGLDANGITDLGAKADTVRNVLSF